MYVPELLIGVLIGSVATFAYIIAWACSWNRKNEETKDGEYE